MTLYDDVVVHVVLAGWGVSEGFRVDGCAEVFLTEHAARLHCCTHNVCGCGMFKLSSRNLCDYCEEQIATAKYENLEKKPYYGGALYCESYDKLFKNQTSLQKWVDEEWDRYLDIRLVLCEGNKPGELDMEAVFEDILEDNEYASDLLSGEATLLFAKLNEVLRNHAPISWTPTEFAVDMETLDIEWVK